LVPIFSLQITTILSTLIFPNFELKFIITFDIFAVDNFEDQIWNQHVMLVDILKYKSNQGGKKNLHPSTHQPPHPPTHPPTHPHNKTFLGFKKGGYYRVK